MKNSMNLDRNKRFKEIKRFKYEKERVKDSYPKTYFVLRRRRRNLLLSLKRVTKCLYMLIYKLTSL